MEQILYGVAAVIVATGFLLFVWQRRNGRMSMSAGPLKMELGAELDEVHRKLDMTLAHSKNIDRAVNNVPPGVPPLVFRVTLIEDRLSRIDRTLYQVAQHVGVKPDAETPGG